MSRFLKVALVVALTMAATTACRPATLGAKCRTTDWGGNGRIVMRCVGGRWQRSMTYGQAATLVTAMLAKQPAAGQRVVVVRSGRSAGYSTLDIGNVLVKGPWSITAAIQGDSSSCTSHLDLLGTDGYPVMTVPGVGTLIPSATFQQTGQYMLHVGWMCTSPTDVTYTVTVRTTTWGCGEGLPMPTLAEQRLCIARGL